MSYLRFVCLLATTLTAAAVLMVVAQSPALQRGISVQLADTSSATPMPDADNQNAWIITVAADGNMYFGIDPVAPGALAESMKARPRNREQKLYIKADAHAPFASVEKAFAAANVVLFQEAVLLTSQGQSQPGRIVLPKGLGVMIGGALPSGTVATVVELFNSRQQPPMLKINNDAIPWSSLQQTLTQHFQKGDEKLILLKADSNLPFADVAHAIDICRATGAKVVLPKPDQL